MDIAALTAFVAVAETGSFSRAAERLFMTQPAVSKRVAALEDNVGVPLLNRLGKQVTATEAGEHLLISARRILDDIATSREEIRSLNDEVSGRLRLGTSHHVGIHRLPPILKSFVQRYPGVELDLLFMDSEEAAAQVMDGTLELAIVTLPDTPEPRVASQLIWPDPLSIVAAPEHPLARCRQVLPSRLADHPAVLPARGTVTRTILFNALESHSVTVNTTLETNYLETIKMMVSVGLGWSALPDSMIDESIVRLPVTDLSMQRELGCLQLKHRTLSRAATALMKLMPADSTHS